MIHKIIIKFIKEYINDYFDLDVIINKQEENYIIKVKHRFCYNFEYVIVYKSYSLFALLFNKEEQEKLNKRINEYITFLN